MDIVKSLTDQANIADDYNDRNLARLCMTAADEIERLREENAAQSALIEFYEQGGKSMDELSTELEANALADEIERLREALAFYADVEKYKAPHVSMSGPLWLDCGQVAQKALNSGEE